MVVTDSKQAIQLRVTLMGVEPTIWRRVQVGSNTRLAELNSIIQILMGWSNSCYHQFIAGDVRYGQPCEVGTPPSCRLKDDIETTLADVVTKPGATFQYRYYKDEDSWRHLIETEKVFRPENGQQFPVVVDGKRNSRPEGCGGPWGYLAVLNALENPEKETFVEVMKQIPEDFDPEQFDPDAKNRALEPLRRPLT